jgi:non-heme chloroperoxidase
MSVKDPAKKSARLIKVAKEIYYPGAPHGFTAKLQEPGQCRFTDLS